MRTKSIYDFKVVSISGQEVSLRDYEGRVLLIVNVASECGFTPQYEGLESMYQKLKDRGFVVLGFPCNQFGGQEPGEDEQIKSFCESRFRVTFPMFSKVEVNGPNAHPLYAFLKKQRSGLLGTEAIKWNFTKFLVDRNGEVVDRYAPQTGPDGIEKDALSLLER